MFGVITDENSKKLMTDPHSQMLWCGQQSRNRLLECKCLMNNFQYLYY